MQTSTHNTTRVVTTPHSQGLAQRQSISPYKAMKAILQGEPQPPAARTFDLAMEQRLRSVERHEVLTHVRDALAWFASLMVLEGD